MTKILLVYPPFCTPASPPYSITYLYAFLQNNLSKKNSVHVKHSVHVLDMNIEFHKKKFKEYMIYCQNLRNRYDKQEYEKKTNEYMLQSEKCYSQNNKLVVHNKKPELFNEMLGLVLKKKPDIVAFSIVYSSQAFYALALLKELKKRKIKAVTGGPAVNEKLAKYSKLLKNELELLEFIEKKKIDHNKLNFNTILDFNIYNLRDYFTPEVVIPLKTSSTCYWQKCTFCTHFSRTRYYEFPLEQIKKSIKLSKKKYVFFIDDMIHKKRLLEIAKVMRPLKVKWEAQLKPTKELDYKTLKTLKDSGLTAVLWGVESGCERILRLMNKGTNKNDITKVLKDSHKAGIKNVIFIMIGFPSETKEEFLQTIDFLKSNSENIDLVSTSVFGLQRGSIVYNEPQKFGITEIREEKRTVLDPKISYEIMSGLTQAQAESMHKKYKKTIEKINKYPKAMNFFREHMLTLE